MEMKTLRENLTKKKFKCTIYAKDGTYLASRIYNSYTKEGALIQLEEWLEVHVPSTYDPDTIKVDLV